VKDLEIQRAARQNMMLLLGLAALALIVGIGIYSIRLKQHTNRELAVKNDIISKSLAEKELLLKEIHHRVKNNLEVISSLLYLQSKYVDDENVLEAIREGQNRVQSMSLIHKNLYQDDNLTGIKMDEYLDKLISTLMRSYKVGNHEIRLKTSIEPLNLDVDTVIPLALIINELISNSLKYAFRNNEQAELSVSLKTSDRVGPAGKEELVLMVADNGPGLPEGFDISKTTSLGYKLIDLFSKKLEGTLSVHNDNGTNVILTFDKFKIV
jgi:two-component sensor histidine kinase